MDACPFLLDAACSEPEAEELAVAPDEGGKATLDAVFAEALFTKYVLQRAHEDVSRLELMQPLINAVKNAGGPRAALDAAEWLSERPEVKNLEEHCDKPAPWWSPRDDRGLLVGTLRHGWGRWDAIRADPELGLEASWESAIAAANGSPRPSRRRRRRSALDRPALETQALFSRFAGLRRSLEREYAFEQKVETGAITREDRFDLDGGGRGGVAAEPRAEPARAASVRRALRQVGGPAPAPKPPREKKARNPREQRGTGPRGPRTAAMGNMDKVERAKLQIDKLPRDKKGRARLPVGPVHGVTLEVPRGCAARGQARVPLRGVHPPDRVPHHEAVHAVRRTERRSHAMGPGDSRGRQRPRVQIDCRRRLGRTHRREVGDGGVGGGFEARVTAARAALGEEPKKTAISGPEFFGYSLPHIRLLVEELPGVAECKEYQPLLERQAKQADEPAEGEAMDVDAA